MARVWLVFFGLITLGFGVVCYVAPDGIADWLGLTIQDTDGRVEFLSNYAGTLPALGVFAIIGSAVLRLRVSAVYAVLVTYAGSLAGGLLALAHGHQVGATTYINMGFQAATVLTGVGALFVARSEVKTNQLAAQRTRDEKVRAETLAGAAQSQATKAAPSTDPTRKTEITH